MQVLQLSNLAQENCPERALMTLILKAAVNFTTAPCLTCKTVINTMSQSNQQACKNFAPSAKEYLKVQRLLSS